MAFEINLIGKANHNISDCPEILIKTKSALTNAVHILL